MTQMSCYPKHAIRCKPKRFLALSSCFAFLLTPLILSHRPSDFLLYLHFALLVRCCLRSFSKPPVPSYHLFLPQIACVLFGIQKGCLLAFFRRRFHIQLDCFAAVPFWSDPFPFPSLCPNLPSPFPYTHLHSSMCPVYIPCGIPLATFRTPHVVFLVIIHNWITLLLPHVLHLLFTRPPLRSPNHGPPC